MSDDGWVDVSPKVDDGWVDVASGKKTAATPAENGKFGTAEAVRHGFTLGMDFPAGAAGEATRQLIQDMQHGMEFGEAYKRNFGGGLGGNPSTYTESRSKDDADRAVYHQAHPIAAPLIEGAASLPTMMLPMSWAAKGAKAAVTAAELGPTASKAAAFLGGSAGEGGAGAGNWLLRRGSQMTQGAIQGGEAALLGQKLSDAPLDQQLEIGTTLGAGIPLVGAAVKGGLDAGNKLIRPFTAGGRASIAEEKLARAAGGAAEAVEPPLPGMALSLGQQTGNPNLLQLERTAITKDADAAAMSQGNAAQNAQVVSGEVGSMAPIDQRAAGTGMRDALDQAQPAGTVRTRVEQDLGEKLGVNAKFYDTKGVLAEEKAASEPLYAKAFQGGSIAPLEKTFEKQFQNLGQKEAEIGQEVAQVQSQLTGGAGKGSQTLETWAPNDPRSSYFQNEKAGMEALTDAQERLAAVRADKEKATALLQRAQADGSANAPGAVWSPRVQQFLDEPTIQTGIKRGLEEERILATAEGRSMNNSEYALAPDGSVKTVPTMKLLDAAKKGLDAMLGDYRDPTSGKLVLDAKGRAIDKLRKSFVGELDSLNPAYAEARAAYAGPAASENALSMGRQIFDKDSEISAKVLADMDPADHRFMRVGVLRAVKDVLDESGNPAQAVKALFTKPGNQEKLRTVFPDEQGYQDFVGRTLAEISQPKEIEKALLRRPDGSWATPESEVFSTFLNAKKPEALDTYLGTLAKAPKEVQEAGKAAARQGFAQKLLDTVYPNGQLADPSKFLAEHKHVLDSALFSPEQRAQIARVGEAASMATREARGAPTKQAKDAAEIYSEGLVNMLLGRRTAGALGAAAGYAVGGAGGPMTEALLGAAGWGGAPHMLEHILAPQRAGLVSEMNQRLFAPAAGAKIAGPVAKKPSGPNPLIQGLIALATK